MIREIALEPTLLNTWQNVRFYLGRFGVAQARLISRFPRRWEQMVLDRLTFCAPVEKLRIVEALKQAKDRLLSRHHQYDESRGWLENAEEEHTRRPFHAIVAATNPRGDAGILLDADIDETRPHPLWQAPRSALIRREAAQMASVVRNLLWCSKTILFIDCNFKPKASRFRLPLAEFLNVLLDERTCKPFVRTVQYHVGVQVQDAEEFQSLCGAWLPEHIPDGMAVDFVLWHPDDLHNRYVVTDRGAVHFGEGLDQAGEDGRVEDIVTLLDEAVVAGLRRDYIDEPPRFRLVCRFRVDGTRKV